MIFVLVHMGALLLDKWVGFGLTEVLVPFTSSYRPMAVAFGIAAFYLLVAVELTSLVMKRLPKQLWHAVHLGSYGLFVLGTVHLFLAGTDATNPLVLLTTALVIAESVAMVAVRVGGRRGVRRPQVPERAGSDGAAMGLPSTGEPVGAASVVAG